MINTIRDPSWEMNWKQWCIYRFIGLVVRVFDTGSVDRGSVPGWVITKTQEMLLDTALHNTQHYKVRIKGRMSQSRERSSALHYTTV